MKIITISREFGSGGRELGKLIAEKLGIAYYDREIITAIAKNQELEEEFVANMIDRDLWKTIPLKFHNSFDKVNTAEITQQDLLKEEQRVLEEIAAKGKDCVIVGRHADYRLKDYKPFRIFVCADLDTRIDNCLLYEETGGADTIKKIAKNIQKIDKTRARNTAIVTGVEWGERSHYDLIVNTTTWDIEAMAPVIAQVAMKWFETHEL
jgi:cytidylate kinase